MVLVTVAFDSFDLECGLGAAAFHKKPVGRASIEREDMIRLQFSKTQFFIPDLEGLWI